MPETTGNPLGAPGSWRLRVHDELWAVYLMTGLAGLLCGLGSAFGALDGGPWPLWVLAALGGLLLAVSAAVLVSIRRRHSGAATLAHSWTRPA